MGLKPNPAWTEACRELTKDQFRRAVQRLKASTDDWPPSLPTFRRWALGHLSEREARDQAALRAEAEVAAIAARYNPFAAPITNQQAEQLRRDRARQYFAEIMETQGSMVDTPALAAGTAPQLESLS